jgi:DNA (cytosine-5)-methyltransferase 1
VSIKINQLDLFSGIGGFHLGFERAGYEVTSYFSEIDKHAVAVYQHKFKDATYVGSVTDVRGADLPNIDLITFGSPCQDFSLAGKRKGMDGERSSLILEAIRLITECQPRAFVWENVKGTFSSNDGEDFAAILQAFSNIGGYRLEWQLLNTSWFLPQNRERIYLVGYSTTPTGDWGGVFPIGEEPRADNGIPRQQGNTCTLTTRYGADGNGSYITKRKQYAQEIGDYRSDEGWRPRKDGNCPTLAARAREDGSGQPLLKTVEPLKIKVANKKGYQEAVDGDAIRLYQPNSETQRGRVGKGVAHTLETTGQQGVVQPNYNYKKVNETIEQNPNEFKEGEARMMDLHNRKVQDISPCLVEPHHNAASLFNGYRIRRLTPIECERLQGFPDNHTEYGIYDGEVKKMSNTQRYKQCGNAVTVDVVKAVAQQLIPIYNA